MADDEQIAACMKAKVEAIAPCPANQEEFYTWLHTNAEKMYWDCGGYSAGGIGGHETRLREAYNAGQLRIKSCETPPSSSSSSSLGVLIVVGIGIAAIALLTSKPKRR